MGRNDQDDEYERAYEEKRTQANQNRQHGSSSSSPSGSCDDLVSTMVTVPSVTDLKVRTMLRSQACLEVAYCIL